MISNRLKRAMLILTVAISASSAFANESMREQKIRPTATTNTQHSMYRDARAESYPTRSQTVPWRPDSGWNWAWSDLR
jgi:hypothetical protein